MLWSRTPLVRGTSCLIGDGIVALLWSHSPQVPTSLMPLHVSVISGTSLLIPCFSPMWLSHSVPHSVFCSRFHPRLLPRVPMSRIPAHVGLVLLLDQLTFEAASYCLTSPSLGPLIVFLLEGLDILLLCTYHPVHL